MYVSEDMIARAADAYGRPETAAFSFPVDDREYRFIRSSQHDGRRHDVTAYIFKGDEVIVIAKHFYPPGMYRAPSGGLRPGESIEAGLAREVHEETGTDIILERFLLRTSVLFTNRSGVIDWMSLVFQARYRSGDFEFTDRREIREVRLAELDEFAQFGRIMRTMDLGGLHYRAALHERIAPLLRTRS